MQFPSCLPNPVELHAHCVILFQGAEIALGHVWKTFSGFSDHCFQLTAAIKKIWKESLLSNFWSKQTSQTQSTSSYEKIKREVPFREIKVDEVPYFFGVPEFVRGYEKNLLDSTSLSLTEENIATGNPLRGMAKVSSDSDLSQLSDSPTTFQTEQVDLKVLEVVGAELKLSVELLEEVKEKNSRSWNDDVILLDKLDNALECLKPNASKFEKSFEKAHCQIQQTMRDLQEARELIAADLCRKMRSEYRPNLDIRSDGHCLFSAIKSDQKLEKKAVEYRSLAAEYIRKHENDFHAAIDDAMKLKAVQDNLKDYENSEGGKQSCFDRLSEKLERAPTKADYYCGCLEQTNLWGGQIEITALSAALEVPILVFARKNSRRWEYVSGVGLGSNKFDYAKTVLLYYDSSHYQNLIKKEKQ